MALHLSGILKDQKWYLGAHFLDIPFFKKKRGEKKEKELGFPRDQDLV